LFYQKITFTKRNLATNKTKVNVVLLVSFRTISKVLLPLLLCSNRLINVHINLIDFGLSVRVHLTNAWVYIASEYLEKVCYTAPV